MEKVNNFLSKYYNNKGLGLSVLLGLVLGAIGMFLFGRNKNTRKR